MENKNHKEALDLVRSMVANGHITQEIAEQYFPELKESEDERTRKEILDYIIKGSESLYDVQQYGKEKFEKWIAWLEKQGEHAKFRDSIQIGDKVTRNEDGVLVNLSQLKRVAKPAEVQSEQKPVEPQQDMLSQEKYAKAVDECIYGKQNNAWSEEDEKFFKTALWHISNSISNGTNTDIHCDTTYWLKSLKDRMLPQNTWKPSDEQIKALLKLEEMHVLEHEKNQENAHLYMVVKSIREQLLKLRER